MSLNEISFAFDNTYARELDGFYTPWQGAIAPNPKIVVFNTTLAQELGLNAEALNTPAGAAILAGSAAPDGATPLAQAYAGHQFGHFSPQLGDGRALLLGEIIDQNGNRRDLQLKGSGRTPFSRGGDGKAVLGPILREYLMGEAMHALGIPTTRALAAVTTGEQIERDGPKPGAVLARVASSHLRVGTFQFFAARGEFVRVKQLADYAIARHYPELANQDDRYLAFLSKVVKAQAALIGSWMHMGFVHGVMNTDNMTISGETIDYGPCAFVDSYDPLAVFSSIDRNGRYAFGNQPGIAQWNLARLAETLVPIVDPSDRENAIKLVTTEVGAAMEIYETMWLAGTRKKIGLASDEAGDTELIKTMFAMMERQDIDFTLFFRHLAGSQETVNAKLLALFSNPKEMENWLQQWRVRLGRDGQNPKQRSVAMNRINPLYIPRNHMVEAALQAAEDLGDMAPFTKLLTVLSDPFVQQKGLDKYTTPAPDEFDSYQTFCGT